MARITVEDCIDKFPSRFELVLVASNRARKLYSGENPTVEIDNDKNTVIALREIAEESIPIDTLKNKLIEEYQTVSAFDEEELNLTYDNSTDDSLEKSSINEVEESVNMNAVPESDGEDLNNDSKLHIKEDDDNVELNESVNPKETFQE